MRWIRFTVALALLVAFTAVPAMADGIVDEIGTNLMCQCGCTMVLASCDCGTAEQMRGEIRDMLGQGKSKPEILNYYVGKYGEKVLAQPPAKNFGLVAWIMPFFALLLGFLAVRVFLLRWRHQTPAIAGMR